MESKSAALAAAVFVDFPKNECNVLHKNNFDIVRRVQLLTGRRPMRSFLVGQSPPLPYGSGAYALTDPRIRNGGGSRVRESVARAARRLRLAGNGQYCVHYCRPPPQTSTQTQTHTQTDRETERRTEVWRDRRVRLSVSGTRSRSAYRLPDVFTHTHTYTPVQRPFVRDYPGEPVPER